MEKNNTKQDLNGVLDILSGLNKLLEEYYNRTLCIKDLLSKEDTYTVINEIQSNLDKRDIIINDYNDLLQKYNTYNELNNNEDIKKLEEARTFIINAIGKLESDNLIVLNKFYVIQQSNMKKINEGKKMHNAYEGKRPTAYGVFVDKKK